MHNTNNQDQQPNPVMKKGISNSIAKITECEESFITNGSNKKNFEESKNEIQEEIKLFESQGRQGSTRILQQNIVGPWQTTYRESNTQGTIRKKGRQHQLQFPRMGVKIKGSVLTIESESSGLLTARDNNEILNPIQQWSPDVGSSQGFSSRYSKESDKPQITQNNVKLSNYRMASKITMPTNTGEEVTEDVTSSMQQTKTLIQGRERFDSDVNQQKQFIISNGFQRDKNRLFSEQNKRQIQGDHRDNVNQNGQNPLMKRQIATSGNNTGKFGIMTAREQQRFFRNTKNHVYLKDLESKSSKLIKPLERTNFKAFPMTSRGIGASPSHKILNSENQLHTDIQSAFDAFDTREQSISNANLKTANVTEGTQMNEESISKVKLAQPFQSNKKPTLLQQSTRHRQLASVRPERKFKMNSQESIESVFAKRSIEKALLKRTSLDINQKSLINLKDEQNESTHIPKELNDKNEEAFGMTILKQFPNGTLSKEIYRQKAAQTSRKAGHKAGVATFQQSLDTTKADLEQPEQSSTGVNSIADLQPSTTAKDAASDCMTESTQKPIYDLRLQRERKERKKNQAAANKSLYINIKQSNLNKDNPGLLRRAQQESLQKLLQKFSDSESKPSLRHQSLRLNELQTMDALAAQIKEFKTDSRNPSQQFDSQIPSVDATSVNQSQSQRGLFSNKHISYKTIQISECDGEEQLPSHYTSIQLDANTSTREEDITVHQLNQNELKPVGMESIVQNASRTQLLRKTNVSSRDNSQPEHLGQNLNRELSYDNRNDIQSLENSSASKPRERSLEMEVPGITGVLEPRRTSKLAQAIAAKPLDFKQEKSILDLIKTIESKTVHLESDLKKITGAHVEFKNDKSSDVLAFFRERDMWVRNVFNQYFRNACFAERYGLPKVLEELLIALVDAGRSDQAEFTKYLQMRKQVADFQSQQMYADMKSMTKELNSFQGKDEAYRQYRERLFDPACANKMDVELLGDLEHYDEMEGAEDYIVPSKFDFNDKVSNAKMPLEKALESVEKLAATNVLDISQTESGVESVPFEYLQQLLDKKTTAVQKKTAFKVLQRYFRNVKTKDTGVRCDLDADLVRQHTDMKARVTQLKQDNENLRAEKERLTDEIERALGQLGKVKAELLRNRNVVEDSEQAIRAEKQKYADLEKTMEAAVARKQKQIDNYFEDNKDVEAKYAASKQQTKALTTEVQVKTVKIVEKVEKIVYMKKDHKQVRNKLKEEKKEYKYKLEDAKKILKMLKQGLISLADINNISDVEESSSSTETDDLSDSDEEILKKAEADPKLKAAIKASGIQEKMQAKKKAAQRKRRMKNGEEALDDEIEYGSDGKEIARKPRQKGKKGKRSGAEGQDDDSSNSDGPGLSSRSRSKKKKKKHKHRTGKEPESSDEEIIDGVRVQKKCKRRKEVEGIDYVYETDPVTGEKKKVFIKNTIPNSKGEVFVDDGYISAYSYNQSEGGTIRRRKKKTRKPGEAPGDSSEGEWEEFDEAKAEEERRENRVRQGLPPEAAKVTVSATVKQALLNKFKEVGRSQEANQCQDALDGYVGQNGAVFKDDVQMFGAHGHGGDEGWRPGPSGFNGAAVNRMMPRKYSNFDKNGMRVAGGNAKETQTSISGPVIQSDLTESLFNKIDELEKQAAQLQDLKANHQRRQELYAQQLLEKQREESRIQELIKNKLKEKLESSNSPAKRMNSSFHSSGSRGRLVRGTSRRIQNLGEQEDRQSLIKGLMINTTQSNHKDTSLTPTRQGNNLIDTSTISQHSSDPHFAQTLQPKTAIHFSKDVLSDGAQNTPMKVSLKTRRTVAFESCDNRVPKATDSLMREDIAEESEISLGND